MPAADWVTASRAGIVGFQGRRLRLPAQAPPGCPRDYVALIADCWHQDATKRPRMKEMVQRINRMSDGMRGGNAMGVV